MSTAERLFEEANELALEDEYTAALDKYSAAIALKAEPQFFVQRAACLAKLRRHEESLQDANKAIELDAGNARAYLRKGIACFELSEFEAAKAALLRAGELGLPDTLSKTAATWVRKCDAELAEEDDSEGEHHGDGLSGAGAASGTPAAAAPTASAAAAAAAAAPAADATAADAAAPAAAAAAAVEALDAAADGPRSEGSGVVAGVRYEWRQTDTTVFLTVHGRNVRKGNTDVELSSKTLDVEIETSGGAFWQHTFLLTAEAKPPPRVEYHGSHMVIALEKKEAKRWSKLLATDVAVADAKPASGKRDPREWERLDKALKKEEEEEHLEGDAALQRLFKQIYANADEDTRRAMIKSYQTSGGTVLSTNWKEVAKTDYEKSITPPDGMELKKYGQ